MLTQLVGQTQNTWHIRVNSHLAYSIVITTLAYVVIGRPCFYISKEKRRRKKKETCQVYPPLAFAADFDDLFVISVIGLDPITKTVMSWTSLGDLGPAASWRPLQFRTTLFLAFMPPRRPMRSVCDYVRANTSCQVIAYPITQSVNYLRV